MSSERTRIVPNELQGGRARPVWIRGTPPVTLTRLGAPKVEFLVRGVAQLKSQAAVLELFGGSGLSTAIIARELSRPERLTSVDLHYAHGSWSYCAIDNYRELAAEFKVTRPELPCFVCADAGTLPFGAAQFDWVIAPDSPRTRFDASGVESGLNDDEQQGLFQRTVVESLRVLKPGGIFAATAPRSWVEASERQHRGVTIKVIDAPSPRLRFKAADDPVVYCRLVRD